MFCIELTNLKNPLSALATSSRVRQSTRQLFVAGDQLSETLQRELRKGAKIVRVRKTS
jgi:phycocyanin-associated rod linker protein